MALNGPSYNCNTDCFLFVWCSWSFRTDALLSWTFAKFFPGGATSTFCLSLSGWWRCNTNGVHKTLYPFCTAQKISHESTHSIRTFSEIESDGNVYAFCQRVYFLSSFTAFGELGYIPITLLLLTADKWVWIGLEQSTTTFVMIPLVSASWTSLLNVWSEMLSTLWLSEMIFFS